MVALRANARELLDTLADLMIHGGPRADRRASIAMKGALTAVDG